MKTLGIGIIGSGGIARAAHMPNYAKLPDVNLIAVADKSAQAGQTAAKQFEVPHVFKDYRDLLKLKEIDAVSVCTPNAYHAESTIAALKAGKHVLCEKPIAMNAGEAAKMVEASKRAGKQLMVAQHHRFGAGVQALKKAIKDGALGEIYYCETIALRRRGIPSWGVFTQKKHSGGGPMIDIGVHFLDQALFLMGHPKPVAATGCCYTKFGKRAGLFGGFGPWDPKKYDVEDMAVGLVRFANGASLVVKTSWAANIGRDEFNTVIMGTEGGCSVDPLGIYREEHGYLVNIAPVSLPPRDAYFEEIKAFVEAVRSNKPVPVPGEQALITQKIMDAIYASAKAGKEVAIR